MPSTSFGITSSANDLWIERKNSGVFPPNTTITVGLANATTIWIVKEAETPGVYGIYNGFLRFDTSSIPDDHEITSAVLQLHLLLKADTDNKSLTADYYTWTGVTGDYTATAGTNAIAGVDITSLSTDAVFEATLLNPDANVSKTSNTSLRLHLSDGLPTGRNYLNIASFDHTTLPEPTLVVNHALPTDTTPPANPTGLTATVIT